MAIVGAGAVLVIASGAAAASIFYTWVEETISGSRIVINATARGAADVIETVFATVESVIREFGSCMNRIAG